MANNKRNRGRLDIDLEIESIDEETGIAGIVLTPKPERYEWRTVDGEKLLYDKLDKVLFPVDVLEKLLMEMRGMPIYHEPQIISNAAVYVESRRGRISTSLNGTQSAPTFADPSDEFLAGIDAETLDFVILSLDLVGSTNLATKLPMAKYLRVIQMTLFEISQVIPLFRGHVLKYTGDGIIAYFPAPSFITKNDLAIDCALTLLRLVRDGINPVLSELNYGRIDVRIGLDSGEAAIAVIGSPTTKEQKDIIGAVVNLACKIQSKAPVGGVALGDVTLRNLHTNWRAICSEMEMGADWQYIDATFGTPYRVHKVHQS